MRLGVRLLVFGLLLGAVGVVFAFFRAWSLPRLDRQLQRRWLAATGVPLTYEKAVFRLSRGWVEIHHPRLLDPQGGQTLLEARRIRIDAPIWPFFFSKSPYILPAIEIQSALKLPLMLHEGRLAAGGSWGRLFTLLRANAERHPRRGGEPARFGLQMLRLDDIDVQLAHQRTGRPPEPLAQINDAKIEADFGGTITPRQVRVDARLNDQDTTRDLHLTLRPSLTQQTCDLELKLDRFDSMKDLPGLLPLDINTTDLKLRSRLARQADGRWALKGDSLVDNLNVFERGTMPTQELGRVQIRWALRIDSAARQIEVTSASLASKVCAMQTSGTLGLRDPFPYRLNLSPLEAQGQVFALIAEVLGRGSHVKRAGEASLRLHAAVLGNLRQKRPETVSGRIELDGFSLHTPNLPPLDNLRLKAEMTTETLNILNAQAVVEGMPMAFSGRIRGHALRGEVLSADVNWKANGDLVSVASILKEGASATGAAAKAASAELQLKGKVAGEGRIFVREPLSGSLASTVERTRLEGKIALDKVTVSHPGLLEPIQQLQGEIDFVENGREARLKKGSGRWMGVNVTLSGSLKGKPLIWNQPRLSLSGAADFDLLKTRALLAEASPSLHTRLQGWPRLEGLADLDFTMEGDVAHWEKSDYKATLNLKDFATELAGKDINGPLRLNEARFSLRPGQFRVAQARGRLGELKISLEGEGSPASGDVRLEGEGPLAEVKARAPRALKLFRVGGGGRVQAAFSVRPAAGFTPPASWEGWYEALRREARPVDWRRWIAERWVFDGGGQLEAREAEWTYHAMPARLWGFNGPLRFDMRHLWTPQPLPGRGGERSVGCRISFDLDYGAAIIALLRGEPRRPITFNYIVSDGHLALEEWLRPWNFPKDRKPGTPITPPPYDPKVTPFFKLHGEFRVPSAAYRDVRIRDFRSQIDLDVTPSNYSNLFTWHDITGLIGEGDFQVKGVMVSRDVINEVTVGQIELAPFIKGLTGKEHVSGIFSGKLSGRMRLHQGWGHPVAPPLEGAGEFRIVESRFVSNSIFNSLFGLLKLPVLQEISFSNIAGPFEIRDGQFRTKGITFDNPTLLHMNAVGTYGPEKKLDMGLQVQFLPKAVERIPLLGNVLEQMNRLIGKAVRVKLYGTIDKPEISLL